jgi:hypothetical protein
MKANLRLAHVVVWLAVSLLPAVSSADATLPSTGECSNDAINREHVPENGMAEANLPPFGHVCLIVRRYDGSAVQEGPYIENSTKFELYKQGQLVYVLQRPYDAPLGQVHLRSIHFVKLGPARQMGIVVMYRQRTMKDEYDAALVFYRDGNDYRTDAGMMEAVEDSATLKEAVRKANAYLKARSLRKN